MTGLPIHKRLFFKLIFFFTLIVFLGSIIGGYVSIRITGNEFNKILKKQFQSNIEVTENFFSFLGQTAMIWSNNIASDENLRTLVVQNDRDAIIMRCMDILKKTKADILILLDSEGNVIVKSNDTGKYGNSLLYWNLVRETIFEGIPSTSIVQDNDNFIIYSSGIIKSANDSDDLPGVVLLGYEINDEFLKKIENNTNIHITIVRHRAVMASSFNVADKRLNTIPIPYIEYQMLLNNQPEVSKRYLFGKEYFVSARNLRMMDKRMAGSMLLAYPMDEMRTIERRLNWEFASLFASSFILIVIIGTYLSKKVTTPITKLTRATKSIAGGDLTTDIKFKSEDEIGQLANAFNKMTRDLSKSRDEIIAARDYADNIVKSMIDTLLVIDPDARIKTINKATLELLGYTEAELIGKPVATIFAEEEEEEEEETPFKGTRMKKLIEEGSIRDYDITYKTKTGEKIQVSFSGSVMRDKEGGLVGIVGVARDMRETRKLITELEKRTERLEKYHSLTVGREMEMVKLKEEINSLLEQSGQPGKYKEPDKIQDARKQRKI